MKGAGFVTVAPPGSTGAAGAATGRRLAPETTLLLVGLVALAGLADLLLQRVLYRVGIHIPMGGVALEAYRAATTVGSFAFNLASVLTALVFVVLVVRLVALQRWLVAALGIWVLAAGATAALTSAPWALLALRALVLVFAIAALSGPIAGRDRPIQLVGAAVLLGFLGGVGSGFGNELAAFVGAGTPAGARAVQTVGELAVVAVGPALWLLASRGAGRSEVRRALIAGAAPAALFMVAGALAPASVGMLALWAVGLEMVVPLAGSAVALWLWSAAVLLLWRHPGSRVRALGAMLLLVAGYAPQSSHDLLVAGVGALLISDAGGERAPAP